MLLRRREREVKKWQKKTKKNGENPSVKWAYLDQTNVESHIRTRYHMLHKIAHPTKLFALRSRHGIESYCLLHESNASTQTKMFHQNDNISITIDRKATNKHIIRIFASFDVQSFNLHSKQTNRRLERIP